MDYPSDEILAKIRKWPYRHTDELIELLRSTWWMPDYGVGVESKRGKVILHLSTLGWSGNEDIIYALQDNVIFWHRYWKKTEKGGHYTFEIPNKKK